MLVNHGHAVHDPGHKHADRGHSHLYTGNIVPQNRWIMCNNFYVQLASCGYHLCSRGPLHKEWTDSVLFTRSESKYLISIIITAID